jgi:hypothetical protein
MRTTARLRGRVGHGVAVTAIVRTESDAAPEVR